MDRQANPYILFLSMSFFFVYALGWSQPQNPLRAQITAGFFLDVDVGNDRTPLKSAENFPEYMRKIPVGYVIRNGIIIPAAYVIVPDSLIRIPQRLKAAVSVGIGPELTVRPKTAFFRFIKIRVVLAGGLFLYSLYEVGGNAVTIRKKRYNIPSPSLYNRQVYYGIDLPPVKVTWSAYGQAELETGLRWRERMWGILVGYKLYYDHDAVVKGRVRYKRMQIQKSYRIASYLVHDIHVGITLSSPPRFSFVEALYIQWTSWYLIGGIRSRAVLYNTDPEVNMAVSSRATPYVMAGARWRFVFRAK